MCGPFSKERYVVTCSGGPSNAVFSVACLLIAVCKQTNKQTNKNTAAVFVALNLSLISISTFHSDRGQNLISVAQAPYPAASFPPWDSLHLCECLFLMPPVTACPPGSSPCLCGGHSPSGREDLADGQLRPSAGPAGRHLLCAASV